MATKKMNGLDALALSADEMLDVLATRQVEIDWDVDRYIEEDGSFDGKLVEKVVGVKAFPGDTGGNWFHENIEEDTIENRKKALLKVLFDIKNSPDGECKSNSRKG